MADDFLDCNIQMTTLTTPRLHLEPFKNSHFEELYYLNSDINVMRYITGRKVTIDETLSHIDLVQKNWKELGFSSWCIFELETGEFIGSCGVQHIEFNPENSVEIGWRLKTSKWGQGFATEAANCMMQFVFAQTDVETLYAICHQENKQSERVMQRLGMDYQGVESWYGLETNVYKIVKTQFLRNQYAHFGVLHRPTQFSPTQTHIIQFI